MRRSHEWLLATVLLLLIPVLSISSHRIKSATFDEPINIVHGWRAVSTGDIDVPVDYAPLSRWLAGLAVGVGSDPPPQLPWSLGILPRLCQKFLYLDNGSDPIVFRARLAFLPLHVLLALAILLTARGLYGPVGGLCALALAVFSPSLLAHGRLVTNDLMVTTFVFCAHALVYTLVRQATVARVVGAGLCLGLAMLAKYSGIFALVTIAVSMLVIGLLDQNRRRAIVQRSLQLMVIIVVAMATVWGFYSLRSVPSDRTEVASRAEAITDLRARTRLTGADFERAMTLAEASHLLPNTYFLGVRYTLKHMEYRLSYFLGERTIEGNVGFFPLVFLFKTPVPLLLLIAIGVGVQLARRQPPELAAIPLIVFPVSYFVISLAASINLGQRYILPVYPFLLVFAGGVAAMLLARRRNLARLSAAVLLAAMAISSLRIHPDYLAYFNVLAGGPSGGSRAFGDSNLDWGQDLARLPAWMEKNGVEHVKLGYFGTALPEALGISFEWLPSVGFLNDRPGSLLVRDQDILVVSKTCEQGFYFQDMSTYDFLRDIDPIDQIGHSLTIYRINSK